MTQTPLQAQTLDAFLAQAIAPRAMLLAPWLTEKSLCMAHSWRGTGKTWIGLGIACAVARGGRFLGWSAPGPRRVLHVDGEMPAAALQDRLRALIAADGGTPPAPGALRILAADLADGGLPDLATAAGQAALDASIAEADLLILDNLSTLCRGLRENEGDDWRPVQDWLLRLRRAGKAVLLLHHSGKGRTQRGASRKEDVLDVVIALRRPDDYGADQGARFEIHFEKARGLYGPQARPVEARLAIAGAAAHWTVQPVDDPLDARIAELDAEGRSQREIAAAVGLALGTVNRRLQMTRAAADAASVQPIDTARGGTAEQPAAAAPARDGVIVSLTEAPADGGGAGVQPFNVIGNGTVEQAAGATPPRDGVIVSLTEAPADGGSAGVQPFDTVGNGTAEQPAAAGTAGVQPFNALGNGTAEQPARLIQGIAPRRRAWSPMR